MKIPRFEDVVCLFAARFSRCTCVLVASLWPGLIRVIHGLFDERQKTAQNQVQ